MTDNYYATTAYSTEHIPQQADAPNQAWLQSLAQLRLPWGSTMPDIVPSSLFEDDMSPHIIRLKEQYKQQLAEDTKQKKAKQVVSMQEIANNQINNDINHQHFIYRPASRWIRFGLFIWGMGKASTPFFAVVLVLTYLLLLIGNDQSWAEYNFMMLIMVLLFIGPLLLLWLLGYLIAFKLPERSASKRRPQWELNRQTGLVTTYSKRKVFSAPFYEWDAYINVIPTQTGTMIGKLYLAHRYQQQLIDLSILAPMGSTTQQLYAAWDFIQNYMNTALALPDMPLLEEFRPFDPQTAILDKLLERQPDYWLTMSDEEWQNKKSQMTYAISVINTESRSNLMANYVNYAN